MAINLFRLPEGGFDAKQMYALHTISRLGRNDWNDVQMLRNFIPGCTNITKAPHFIWPTPFPPTPDVYMPVYAYTFGIDTIISCCGTRSLDEWVGMVLGSFFNIDSDFFKHGGVHPYFQMLANIHLDWVASQIFNFSTAKTVFIGHSEGAAAAHLLADNLFPSHHEWMGYLSTTGSPRIRNDRERPAAVYKYLRLINEFDPVPMLPPRNPFYIRWELGGTVFRLLRVFGYHHEGTPIILFNNGGFGVGNDDYREDTGLGVYPNPRRHPTIIRWVFSANHVITEYLFRLRRQIRRADDPHLHNYDYINQRLNGIDNIRWEIADFIPPPNIPPPPVQGAVNQSAGVATINDEADDLFNFWDALDLPEVEEPLTWMGSPEQYRPRQLGVSDFLSSRIIAPEFNRVGLGLFQNDLNEGIPFSFDDIQECDFDGYETKTGRIFYGTEVLINSTEQLIQASPSWRKTGSAKTNTAVGWFLTLQNPGGEVQLLTVEKFDSPFTIERGNQVLLLRIILGLQLGEITNGFLITSSSTEAFLLERPFRGKFLTWGRQRALVRGLLKDLDHVMRFDASLGARDVGLPHKEPFFTDGNLELLDAATSLTVRCKVLLAMV